ncbi:nickel pincer cofactor biosynthesis protein LarC [Guggenheimella bovis]
MILYLDLSMGASGDMLTSALLGLFDDPFKIQEELNDLKLSDVHFALKRVTKSGIVGLKMDVETEQHGHVHRSLQDVLDLIEKENVEEPVKSQAKEIYKLIAEAESTVHGVSVSDIHFHEVGRLDAIADITAVCYLINKLNPTEIIASPVHVGFGSVETAHGLLPVPAPATALLLEGIPVYSKIEGELCTPTGAALLKYFVDRFERLQDFSFKRISYGMGTKEFEQVNCLRAYLGERAKNESIVEFNFNVDDMTAEEIAFATEKLLAGGALDVYTVSVGMKKNRPGTLFVILCEEEKKEEILEILFKHTTTIGVREKSYRRHTLERTIETVETKWGSVRKKVSKGFGVVREKYEFEDLKNLAEKHQKSISEIRGSLDE